MSIDFQTTYVLDKTHFAETYDQSVEPVKGLKPYAKSFILLIIGVVVLLTQWIAATFGWFMLALAGIDALGVYFHRTWWLWRQMLSRAANTELTLTVDNEGIKTESNSVKSRVAWTDISKIEETEKGWLLYQGKARFYLSRRCVDDQVAQRVHQKSLELQNPK